MMNEENTPLPGKVQHKRTLPFFNAGFGRLAVIVALAATPFGTLEFLLPLYTRALGGSPTLIGVLVGLGAAVGVLIRPLAGWLADRGRAPLLLQSGVLALAGGLGCWMLASDVLLLIIGRVGVSLGLACLGLATQMLVVGLAGATQRASAFGRITAASAIGHVIGAIITGVLLVLWDAETQHEVRSLLLALNLPSYLPQAMERVTALHLVFSAYTICVGGAFLLTLQPWQKVTPNPARPRLWRTWRALASQSALRTVILAGLLISIGYSLSVPMILPLLQDRFSAGLGGLAVAYALPGVLYTIAPTPLGRRADRWGYRRAISAGLLVSASVYALLPLLPALGWTALLWSAEALAYSLYVPALQALLATIAPQQHRGAAFSLYSIVAALGAVLAAPLGGMLYQHLAPAVPFGLSALALLAASLVIRHQRE